MQALQNDAANIGSPETMGPREHPHEFDENDASRAQAGEMLDRPALWDAILGEGLRALRQFGQ